MIIPEPAYTQRLPHTTDLAAAEAIVFGTRPRRPSTPPRTPTADDLSQRERQILVFVGRGLSNGDVARGLGLSVETVKSHMRRVLGKLGARNRCHAVALAYEYGILAPGALRHIAESAPADAPSARPAVERDT